MHSPTYYIFLVIFLFLLSFTLENKLKNAPIVGDPNIRNSCKNVTIKANPYTLYANCQTNDGSYKRASVDFSNCVMNYEGYLTPYDGRNEELKTNKCKISNWYQYCQCEQPDHSFKECVYYFPNIIQNSDGQLSCI